MVMRVSKRNQVIREEKSFEPLYVRPADAVALTGASKSAVMAALWSGELVGFQKGRTWFIPYRNVQAWIEGGEQTAA